MKRVKIIVIQELDIPDDSIVTVHPTDQVECLEINGKYYMPTATWLERADEAEIALDVHADSEEEEQAGADWYLSENADLLLSGLITEDGIIHEIKTERGPA